MKVIRVNLKAREALVILCAFIGLSSLTRLRSIVSHSDDTNGRSSLYDASCYHPHDGVPKIHDLDPDFVATHTEMYQGFKIDFDGYGMPDLVTVENSFYFRTLHPKEITGKNWPALSRAWNDSFVVVDDPVEFPTGPIWGNKEIAEAARKEWSINSDSHDKYANNVKVLPPGDYATFSGWYVGNFGHYLHDHVSKIAWIKEYIHVSVVRPSYH